MSNTHASNFKLMPVKASHWMALSAHEITGITLHSAHTAYACMVTSAADAIIPSMANSQVAQCIESARRLAEIDESRTWAQHLVLVVQKSMASSLGARISTPKHESVVHATVK